MYEQLIAQLRYKAAIYALTDNEHTAEYELFIRAANTIEELVNKLNEK
jgi:hypothetical protein